MLTPLFSSLETNKRPDIERHRRVFFDGSASGSLTKYISATETGLCYRSTNFLPQVLKTPKAYFVIVMKMFSEASLRQRH